MLLHQVNNQSKVSTRNAGLQLKHQICTPKPYAQRGDHSTRCGTVHIIGPRPPTRSSLAALAALSPLLRLLDTNGGALPKLQHTRVLAHRAQTVQRRLYSIVHVAHCNDKRGSSIASPQLPLVALVANFLMLKVRCAVLESTCFFLLHLYSCLEGTGFKCLSRLSSSAHALEQCSPETQRK